MKYKKEKTVRARGAVCLTALLLLVPGHVVRASQERTAQEAQTQADAEKTAAEEDDTLAQYEEYQARLNEVARQSDIARQGFEIVEDQIFPIEITGYGEVSLVPAFDQVYHRLALFFVQEDGTVFYKTEQLEVNSRLLGRMQQPDCDLAAVSFRDLDEDGRMDIILITSCAGTGESLSGTCYKMGDVLFQSRKDTGFYRDYRISEKINRFGMNKSAEVITAFVRDGFSTEFLYLATTREELLAHGLEILEDQCYFRTFGKLGRLQVVPGSYRISNYDIFMIYLVNEQGDIIASLQPMGDYDSLYALKSINCRDIDGDGLKDIVILARYSREGENGETVIESSYSIYYQRTGGFSPDTEIQKHYVCTDEDTMETVVSKARSYWGWQPEEQMENREL